MNINQPKFFSPRKNQVTKDWQLWKNEFIVYLRLSNGYEKCSEEQRALLLLNLMGTEAHEAMSQITFENPSSDKKDMDILLAKFDEFFDSPLNEVEERFEFFSRRKSPNEDLDKYILDLKDKAIKCNFGNDSEKFIIDMLILSMDDHLRELIWAADLKTLSEIEKNFKQHDITQNKLKEISETTKRNLNSRNSGNSKSYNYEQPQKSFPAKRVCSKCGENHPYKQCPAFDEICRKCFVKGHYTHKCKKAESANKVTDVLKDEKNMARAKSLNEESKPSTSKSKQGQEDHPKNNTLENCLWCDSYHIPEKCPHDKACTSCNKFPHNICFNCKKNPHQHNCYYKTILTLPSKSCTNCRYNHGNNPCKYCVTCQAYGHWDNECPKKINRANNSVQHIVNELADGFVEIGNALRPLTQPRAQPQPRIQIPVQQPRRANPNQYRQNPRPQSNPRNKDDKSDSCCIS